MVQCDRCRRWAYLDETDFPSTDAADATVFVCHLCTTIEVLETRLRVSEKVIETLQGVILAVKDQLQEPLKDDEHSCSPQPILTVSAASQAHSVEGAEVQQKRDHPGIVPNGGQTLQSVQEQLSPADAGTQSGEGAQRDDGGFVHASGEAQGLSEQTQDTGCIGETRRPKHGADDEPNKRKADDRDQTRNTGRRPKKKRKKNKKATRCSTPEILVIGDGNVPRIAGELRKIWGNSVRVRYGFERRMTTDKLQHLLQKHSDGEGRSSQVVVVHLGIHDVLKGAQHGDIAQTIGQAVTPYVKKLAICSVPEITTRGKATQARAMLLNTELRKMSGALKAKFVDLSRVLAREGRLAQDGIHYLASTTREVATQLAKVTHPFLGIHEPHMNSGKPSRRPLQTTGSNAPVPAVEKQFPTPEPPGTANRINIHQREIGGDVQYALGGTLHEHTQLDYSTTKGQVPTLNTPLRSPGKSSVPLTWGQHLGIAHPTVTPWQALSPSVSPELYQMVGEMVRQQMMQQHLRLPTQIPQ